MRDLHYKNRCLRVSDQTWKLLKEKRKKSGDSWNVFLLKLMKTKI